MKRNTFELIAFILSILWTLAILAFILGICFDKKEYLTMYCILSMLGSVGLLVLCTEKLDNSNKINK